MNAFVRKHIWRINFNVSLAGAAGLGYWTLRMVDMRFNGLGLAIAVILVLFMAVAKIYLGHVVSGAHFWPKWMRNSH